MSVASKNIFELLGNDPDSDGEVKAPTRQVIKQVQTTKKKDVAPEAPATAQKNGGRNNRKYQGNEAAIRDRDAGHEKNKSRTEGVEAGEGGYRHRGDREGGRGGRGAYRGDKRGGGRGRTFDRHSQTGRVDTAKATGQGWGANTGDAEWSDEKTGEAIAQGEATGAGWDAADPATAEAEPVTDGEPKEEAEPEEKVKTYEEYQQELKEKRAALNAPAQIRQPNEGSRDNKKWENATVLNKVEEDAYVAPKEGKAKAPKERKTKQLLEIEHTYQEPRSERGGRGGRGRGEGRGGRGRGEGRGGNRGDRAPRGGAPRAAGASVNLQDESAFPALA